MRKIIFIFFLSSILIYSQEYPIKRLFNIPGNIKNPAFFYNAQYSGYFYRDGNDLLFELEKDSSTEIEISHYDPESDSFMNPFPLINNGCININPSGKINGDNKIVIFQTNLNGNWDIGYKEFINNQWKREVILSDSTGDETNPVFINYPPYYYSGEDTLLRILYEKDNSIYLFTRNNNLNTKELIFKGSDSIQFFQPGGKFSLKQIGDEYVKGYEIVAKMKAENSEKIVLLFKPSNKEADTSFVTVDSGEVNNPKFLQIGGQDLSLTYEKVNNIYIEIPYSSQTIFNTLRDNVIGKIYYLSTISESYPVTKNPAKNNDVSIYFPYTFVNYKNDSTFIFLNQDYKSIVIQDIFTYTKVKDNRPSVGIAGFSSTTYNEIDYIIWEDTADDKIQLYGKRYDRNLGGVNDEDVNLNKFYLFPNYPNPFNPSTIIEFIVPQTSFVSLKIFDILGREVATLVNEEKLTGIYTVKFSAENLASGVYIYQLKSGNFVQSKKMIILR